MTIKAPELLFDFYKVGRKDTFNFGKLFVRTKSKYLKFHATTGLPGFQDLRDCGTRMKGGIPPCELVSVANYTVSTSPTPMPKLRGVEGNFYQIFPYLNRVRVNDHIYTRGDFGIHQDAGVLGTAGCIGVTKGMHWKAFELTMKELLESGINFVPLFVPMGY